MRFRLDSTRVLCRCVLMGVRGRQATAMLSNDRALLLACLLVPYRPLVFIAVSTGARARYSPLGGRIAQAAP